MAKGTHFKYLRIHKTKLESLFQTETLKKEATEGWLNDYMKGLAANMEEKFDNVSKTLAML